MFSQVIIVGRFKSHEPTEELVYGHAAEKVTVDVEHTDSEDKVVVNTIPVIVLKNTLDTMLMYTKTKSMIGIKAHLEDRPTGLKVIADKITMLSQDSLAKGAK